MARFKDTDVGFAFIATADSRETSREIMEAIAFFARDEAEAVALWEGDGFGTVCDPSDIWEHVTGNGRRDADEFCWGAAGHNWWEHIQVAERVTPVAEQDAIRAHLAQMGYSPADIDAGMAYAADATGDEALSLAVSRILYSDSQLEDGSRFGVEPGSVAGIMAEA